MLVDHKTANLTMPKALQIFNNWARLRGLSAETMRGYEVDSRQFVKWYGGLGLGLTEVTSDHIEGFVQYLIDQRGCKATSVNRKLNTLDRFFYCLKKKGWVPNNPVDEVERLKTTETERTYLNPCEIQAMLSHIAHPILYFFVCTMVHTGIRVSECRNLQVTDVDIEERRIRIRNGKGGRHRIVPIGPKLQEELIFYLQRHRPHTESTRFFALEKTGSVSTQYVNQILWKAGRKAGITKHVTSHTLRHSFASHLVRQGTHIAVNQKLLGHANLKTTSIYLHIQQDEMKAAVENLDFTQG
ncbi:tyrosine-type recombinase/integrase [Sporosarcina sp. FSL W7-1349]|uniref:tyrosine-type recombinase/integrase n=1 Tax=Sporosarcina sp. FSL W7-1349 TaxID=2921561 RepID=UPI0030FABEE4